MRVDSEHPQPCAICDTPVAVRSSTSPHPEAPEMFSLPPGATIGFVQGDHAPELFVTCSERCLTQYLRGLSLRERVELQVHAAREHASASDNPVQRLPRPSHLPPPWRGHAIRTDAPTVLRAPSEVD